jgi:hypothetical protein
MKQLKRPQVAHGCHKLMKLKKKKTEIYFGRKKNFGQKSIFFGP